MRYLGNIVTESKKKREDYIKVVSDIKDIDANLPTLIIGWDKVKDNFPDASILKTKIDNNFSWTFRFNERNKRYKIDLEDFMSNVSRRLYNSIKYEYFSIALNGYDILKRKLNGLKGNGYFYVHYNMIYIFSPEANKVLGVSVEECTYSGILRKDLITMILNHDLKEIKKDDVRGDFKKLMYEKPYITPYLALICK